MPSSYSTLMWNCVTWERGRGFCEKEQDAWPSWDTVWCFQGPERWRERKSNIRWDQRGWMGLEQVQFCSPCQDFSTLSYRQWTTIKGAYASIVGQFCILKVCISYCRMKNGLVEHSGRTGTSRRWMKMNGVWTVGIVGLEKNERIQKTHGILGDWHMGWGTVRRKREGGFKDDFWVSLLNWMSGLTFTEIQNTMRREFLMCLNAK